MVKVDGSSGPGLPKVVLPQSAVVNRPNNNRSFYQKIKSVFAFRSSSTKSVLRPSGNGLSRALMKSVGDNLAAAHGKSRTRNRLVDFAFKRMSVGSGMDRRFVEQNLRKIDARSTDPANQAVRDFFIRDKALKVSAGQHGIRGNWHLSPGKTGISMGKAMRIRQMVREATLGAFAKTGSVQYAAHVRATMLAALKKPDNKLGQRDTQFSAMMKYDAMANTEFQQLYREIRDKTVFELTREAKNIGGSDQIKNDSDQIRNDRAIAREFHKNQKDLQNLTAGNIKPRDFIRRTPGNLVGRPPGEGDQIRNDKAIAREFYKNQKDLYDLTAGNIRPQDIIRTPGNLVGKPQAAEDRIKNDEQIADQRPKNQFEPHQMTRGNLKDEVALPATPEGADDREIEGTGGQIPPEPGMVARHSVDESQSREEGDDGGLTLPMDMEIAQDKAVLGKADDDASDGDVTELSEISDDDKVVTIGEDDPNMIDDDKVVTIGEDDPNVIDDDKVVTIGEDDPNMIDDDKVVTIGDKKVVTIDGYESDDPESDPNIER